MTIIARTARLLLRTWELADAPALLRIYSDPRVYEHIPHVKLEDVAGAEAKIRLMQAGEMWAVERDGELVGACGFPRPGELGFALRPDQWRQGIAVEAAQACIEARPVRRMVALTRPANTGSRRVLDKLGFRECGEKDGWLIYERLTA